MLTSLSASAVLGEQTYGPYGNQRYTQGSLGTDKGYTGQFHDAATGLDYYNARYYDPVMGAFLSPDHVQGNAQGMNPCSYVAGNPETNTDPTGQRVVACTPDENNCGKGGNPDCPSGTSWSNGACIKHGNPQPIGPTAGDCKNQGLVLQGGVCVYIPPACDAKCQQAQQKQQAEEKAQKIARDAEEDFQGMENWLRNGGFLSWLPSWLLDLIGGVSGISAIFLALADIADVYAKGFAAMANRSLDSFDCSLCSDNTGIGDAASRLTAQIVFTVLILGVSGFALKTLGAFMTGLAGKVAGFGGDIAKFISRSITYLGVAGPVQASYVAASIWGGSWYFEDKYDSYLSQISQAEFEGGM